MVNLLIISSNPKTAYIQNALQPLLKAKIDVVSDFDHGLKDVFEKRPSIVVIQDQIASVTGESVARHIQLLLGSEAPKFIVLHEANARVKTIKGLFEHAVDLHQAERDLIHNLIDALKKILGSGWDKVAVSEPPASSGPVSPLVTEDKKQAADQLVDDLLVDIGGPGSPSDTVAADPANATLQGYSDSTDELASLLLAAVHESRIRQEDAAQQKSPPQAPQPVMANEGDATELPSNPGQTVSRDAALELSPPATAPESGHVPDAFDFPELEQPVTPPAPVTPAAPAAPALSAAPVAPAVQPDPVPAPAAAGPRKIADTPPARPVSPADFRIPSPKGPDRVPLPDDILTAFDANYRSRSRTWLVFSVAVALLVFAGWYLLSHGIDILPFFQKSKQPVIEAAPAAPQPAAVKPGPLSAVQKPLSAKGAAVAAEEAEPLPGFVPAEARDGSFAKPGWERYVDAEHDVRVYRAKGRIRAVQVIAVKDRAIPVTFLKTVLKEMTGGSESGPVSLEKSGGYLIKRCRAGQKGDLVVYYQEPAKVIRAFVVSMD